MKKSALSLSVVLLISVMIFSCNPTPKVDPLTALASNTWMLESMKGEKADSTGFSRGVPYLDFDAEEMHVSGFAGCNRVMGSFGIEEENGISLDKLASTRMACAGVDGETAFLSVLGTVTGFKVEKQSLKFTAEGSEVMTFVPKEGE